MQSGRALHLAAKLSFAVWTAAPRRFTPPWTVKELNAMTANQPMTAEQAATLKRLAEASYELDAFKPNLTRGGAADRDVDR